MNKNTETSKLTEISTGFRHDIIKDVLKSKITNPRSKLSDDAIELISEIAKVMVIEASLRAAKQASLEDRSTINLDHVETILPQLMLDFP